MRILGIVKEPTSGLDARAAAIVMRTVKNIATTRSLVATIHQPSQDVFEVRSLSIPFGYRMRGDRLEKLSYVRSYLALLRNHHQYDKYNVLTVYCASLVGSNVKCCPSSQQWWIISTVICEAMPQWLWCLAMDFTVFWALFLQAFDELVLLKRGGRMMYAGPTGHNSQKLIAYFEAIPGVVAIKEGINPGQCRIIWALQVPHAKIR